MVTFGVTQGLILGPIPFILNSTEPHGSSWFWSFDACLGMTLNSSVAVLIMTLNSSGANKEMILWAWLQFVLPWLILLFGHTRPSVELVCMLGRWAVFRISCTLFYCSCAANVNVRILSDWLLYLDNLDVRMHKDCQDKHDLHLSSIHSNTSFLCPSSISLAASKQFLSFCNRSIKQFHKQAFSEIFRKSCQDNDK